jgi:hypothetical protein
MLSMEQVQVLRDTLHCEVKLTAEHRMKWSTPMTNWSCKPQDLGEHDHVEREHVYEIRICESDLQYLITVLSDHEEQQQMVNRYSQVQEAWMNLRTIMCLIRDYSPRQIT